MPARDLLHAPGMKNPNPTSTATRPRSAAEATAGQQAAPAPGGSATTLQVDGELPQITPAHSLTGWHREFCVELQGDGRARIFVRAVQQSSLKATELRQATLFHRLDPRFLDLEGCVEYLRTELQRLAGTARRPLPSKDNLFITLSYDRDAWERIEQGLDRWARR